jgi:hypothetical protein
MSIFSIDNFKLIEEEVTDFSEIFKRTYQLLIDLGSDEIMGSNFAAQLDDSLDGATSVSFLTIYKDYVIPKNYAGIALIKWVTPVEYNDYLAPSDFCVPMFIAQKASPEFARADQIMEEFIRLEAEARHYSYELKESLNL